jgi:hypothetical protein
LRYISIFIFMSFGILSLAQLTSFQWAKQFGGGANTFGTAITCDASGNVISTGYFDSSVDFDPGPGTYALSAPGTLDAFVTKLNANGTFLWARQMNFPITGDGQAIALDMSGNIYVTGSVGPPPGGEDIHISKLNSAGTIVWQKQIGGALTDFGRSIAVDGSNNVYVAGEFTGTVDFDPGPGSYTLSSGSGTENFILKLDGSGNFVWAKHVASTSLAKQSIAVDTTGDVYYTGEFVGLTDFDPNAGIYTLSGFGNTDIFICKLSSVGNFIWAKEIGGPSSDRGFGIATNSSNDVYLSASFYGIADIDPGPATFTVDQTVSGNALVIRLNSSGSTIWTKAFGAGSGVLLYNICVHNSCAYSIGSIVGTSDMDPGPGTSTLSTFGSSDIIVHKLTQSGFLEWVKQIGGAGTEYEGGICVDPFDHVYTTGSFQQTCDFNPGPSFNLGALSSNTDAFVHSIAQPNVSGTNERSTIDSFKLYPNPVSTFLNISGTFPSESMIAIISSIGKTIIKAAFANSIDVSALAPGVYIVKIDQPNQAPFYYSLMKE